MSMYAPGDEELLWALLEYRVLTSGQLAWLTGRSTAVIRRRMRKHLVSEAGVVRALIGARTDQKAYCLSKVGFAAMAQRAGLQPSQMPFSAKPPTGPASPFFRHMKLSNDIWIFFRRACQEPQSPVQLTLAIPEWEMSPDPTKRRSKKPWERFLISERLEDLSDPGRSHVLRPDLLLIFKTRQEPMVYVATYLEADRATVSVRGVIMQKLLVYWHLFLRRGFERHGAQGMRVLFVVGNTRTDQRVRSVQAALVEFCRQKAPDHEHFVQQRLEAVSPEARERLARRLQPMSAFAGCFRFARRQNLNETNILRGQVWQDGRGQQMAFFRGQTAADDPKTAPSPAPKDPESTQTVPVATERSTEPGPPTPRGLCEFDQTAEDPSRSKTGANSHDVPPSI